MKRKYSVAFPSAGSATGLGLVEPLLNYRFSDGYSRTSRVIRRAARRLNPFKRRRTTGSSSSPAYVPPQGTGMSIHNARARNVKRRRGRRMIRIARRRISRKNISVAGKLMEKTSFRMALVDEMELERGRVLLPNIMQAAGLASYNHLPLQLIDLSPLQDNKVIIRNLCHDRNNTIGGINDPQYFFTPDIFFKSDTDGEGTNASDYIQFGLASQGRMISTGPTPLTDNTRKVYQGKVKVDLMLYGQDNIDTLYRIDIVRFSPDMVRWIDTVTAGATAPPASTMNSGQWKQFWHALTAPYISSPLAKLSRDSKLMKIIKTYKFKIPEQSADFDRVQVVKTRITHNINRVLNRYWKAPAASTDFTTQVEPDAATNLELQDQYTTEKWGDGWPHPLSRTFMMIRATNPNRQLNTLGEAYPVTKGKDPTYDINFRTEFTFNPINV